MDRYYVFGNKTNGSQDNGNQGLSKITYVLSYNDPSIKDLKGSRETLVAAMKNEVGEPDSESKSVTTWIEEEFQIEIGRAKVSKYTGSDEPTIIIIFSEPETSPDTLSVPVKPSVSDLSFEKIDYNGVSRYPEQYKGRYVMFTGIIVQVMENDSTEVLRVSTRFKPYNYMGGYETEDIVYVEIDKNKVEGGRLLEDDKIDVWGIYDGIETYTSILGNTVSIPRIEGISIKLS